MSRYGVLVVFSAPRTGVTACLPYFCSVSRSGAHSVCFKQLLKTVELWQGHAGAQVGPWDPVTFGSHTIT